MDYFGTINFVEMRLLLYDNTMIDQTSAFYVVVLFFVIGVIFKLWRCAFF